MIQPSEEQQKILEKVGQNNLIVNSVAGSGKTTTSLFIAKYNPSKQILLLTYNRKLKEETKQKFKKENIINTETHTYHSFCNQKYLNQVTNDRELQITLDNDVKKKKNFHYDIIIIDEAQDMTPLYFKLILKICKDNLAGDQFTFCIMGDYKQCIYEYMGADKRFIQMADTIFGKLNSFPWVRENLSQSFRLTSQMSDFVNITVQRNEQKIQSSKDGKCKPRYLICDAYIDYQQKQQQFQVLKQINDLIQKKSISKQAIQKIEQVQQLSQSVVLEVFYYLAQGYKYEDIFILSPSIKEKTPASVIANDLSAFKVPLLVATQEDSSNDALFENKIVFLTYHRAKGLERKVVIVLNFDESYHKYYLKNECSVCSNTHHVAITRSSEQMTVVQYANSNRLRFLNANQLKDTSNIIGNLQKLPQVEKPERKSKITTKPAQLVSYLKQEVIDQALSYLTIEKIQQKGNIIDIPKMTKQGFNDVKAKSEEKNVTIYENTNEINETAIIAYLDIVRNKECFIFESFEHEQMSSKQMQNSNHIQKMLTLYEEQQTFIENPSIPDLLFMSNYYLCLNANKAHAINQISSYDWVEEQKLQECSERLKPYIKSNCILQSWEAISVKNILKEQTLILETLLSCIQENEYWEIRFIENIQQTHLLLLAIQKYIYLKSIKADIKKRQREEQINEELLKQFESSLVNQFGDNEVSQSSQISEKEKTDERNEIEESKIDRGDNIKTNTNQNKIEFDENQYSFKIINVKDGEIYQEKSKLSDIEKMVFLLVEHQYGDKEQTESFEIFQSKISQFYQRYYFGTN